VVTYNVLCSVDRMDVQLLPSMTATVTITTEQDDNALLVPNSALSYAQTQSRSSGSAVYVLRNGTPTRRQVQTGSSDGQNTLVVSGLEPGEQIVTGMLSSGSQATTPSPRGAQVSQNTQPIDVRPPPPEGP
jgi:HlyD family secretion protein